MDTAASFNLNSVFFLRDHHLDIIMLKKVSTL